MQKTLSRHPTYAKKLIVLAFLLSATASADPGEKGPPSHQSEKGRERSAEPPGDKSTKPPKEKRTAHGPSGENRKAHARREREADSLRKMLKHPETKKELRKAEKELKKAERHFRKDQSLEGRTHRVQLDEKDLKKLKRRLKKLEQGRRKTLNRRKEKHRRELRAKLKDRPLAPPLRKELRRHAWRVARIQRLIELAEAREKPELKARAEKLLKRELEKHGKRVSEHLQSPSNKKKVK